MIILLAFVSVECTYRVGLKLLPDLPIANEYTPLSPVINSGIWAGFYEEGSPQVTPFMPWNILAHMLIGCNLPGEKITTYLSNKLLGMNTKTPPRMLIHHLQLFSLSVWVSRNWTTDQIISTVGSHIFINNTKGIKDIADHYLNKKVNSLNLEEIALIMAAAKGPFTSKDNDRVKQMEERRNQVLKRMFVNGAITENQFLESTSLPISRWINKRAN